MKSDKKFRAEHIIQMTKRFNDGSRLVGSEIVSRYYLHVFHIILHIDVKYFFYNFSSSYSYFRIQTDATWLLVLRQLKNGQQSLTFVVVYTILMEFYRFVRHSRVRPFIE